MSDIVALGLRTLATEAILLDLIAELREEPVRALSWGDRWDLADRAEARLREVRGE